MRCGPVAERVDRAIIDDLRCLVGPAIGHHEIEITLVAVPSDAAETPEKASLEDRLCGLLECRPRLLIELSLDAFLRVDVFGACIVAEREHVRCGIEQLRMLQEHRQSEVLGLLLLGPATQLRGD